MATNVRLTALSISSTHMNSTSGLRRTITPTTPMENSTADSMRYQVVVGAMAAIIDALPSKLALARLAGQHHGADDGDDEQHRGELEGQHVVAEHVAGERLDVAVVRRRAVGAGDLEPGCPSPPCRRRATR